MSRYYKWAQRKHGTGTQIVALLPAGVILLILFPFVIVKVGPSLDLKLGLPRLDIGVVNYILGGLLVVVGLFFGLWSVYEQLTRGRGTPLPMLPTQELLIRGPFRYCRNPMTLGTILAYLGIGVIARTISGIGFVLCFATILVLYIKLLEEKELAERFGEAYLLYKREVPFMLPRLPKRQ